MVFKKRYVLLIIYVNGYFYFFYKYLYKYIVNLNFIYFVIVIDFMINFIEILKIEFLYFKLFFCKLFKFFI